MTRMVIQTHSRYIQIELISTQNIQFPDSVEKEPEPRLQLFILQSRMEKYLAPRLGKVKESMEKSTGFSFCSILYLGKRKTLDLIAQDSIMIFAFGFAPIIVGIIVVIFTFG